MQRSMRLGHCICDPKKPCPCPLYKEKDICQCAGERLDVPAGPVKLTELVEKAGCASKIDQAFLKQVLRDLPASDDPRVMVGVPAGDDAGIYKLTDELALVQTVDVFTPSVDDPYMFGQVAAANSLSDIYAMGGQALTALSVIGFPARAVSDQVMHDMLRGGLEKMAQAGVAVPDAHLLDVARAARVDQVEVPLRARLRGRERDTLEQRVAVHRGGLVRFEHQVLGSGVADQVVERVLP